MMENVKTFHVEGMACMHCEARVEKAVASLGAKEAVDLTNKKVTVTGDASDEKIIEVITAAGYKASRI
ncbi:MAG: heavy-metal-associated domain-containing protein [Firmicutes bacterium]|nr:heavy-metal-associated domain-containing protein [Bacillota bacterium]